MIHLSNTLLLLFLLKDTGHFILAHQPLSTSDRVPSAAAYLNTSTAASSPQANIPDPLPSPFIGSFLSADVQNYQDIESGFCAIGDNYCSFEGNDRIANFRTKTFNDQCLLWDTACSGNRTLAIEHFFNNTLVLLSYSECFSEFSSEDPPGSRGIRVLPSDCEKFNTPERLSEWQKIKNWMRSPDCVSAQNERKKMGGKIILDIPAPLIPPEVGVPPSCCGVCEVGAANVDIYYWPEPDVDTSCLDIIGTTVNPIGYGATTKALHVVDGDTSGPNQTFWACPAENPMTYHDFGITNVQSIVTTASLTNIGSLEVKVPLFNPWASSPCIKTDTTSPSSNGSNSSAELHARYGIQAREHSLVIPSSITKENGSPVSTAVLGNFTLLVPNHRIYFEPDIR